jgi:hemoglobin-like flavoprotein
MSLNVPLLRTSFDQVVELAPDLTARFYQNLFRLYPETRSMFSPSRQQAQEKMLTDALVAVLDHLEDAPWLKSTLQALGAKHVDYGVRDEMYGWVGHSLLTTLEEVAGDSWSAELAGAWNDALGAIAGLMLEGAAARRTQAVAVG